MTFRKKQSRKEPSDRTRLGNGDRDDLGATFSLENWLRGLRLLRIAAFDTA